MYVQIASIMTVAIVVAKIWILVKSEFKVKSVTWWPWILTLTVWVESYTMKVHPTSMFLDPGYDTSLDMNFGQVWILVKSEFWWSDRQTDRKWRLRAHRACWHWWAQKFNEPCQIIECLDRSHLSYVVLMPLTKCSFLMLGTLYKSCRLKYPSTHLPKVM